MYRNIDKSFEDYLEKKHLGTSEVRCWEEGHRKAMGHADGPFIAGLPIKTGDFRGLC
jgi:hypothetical protein